MLKFDDIIGHETQPPVPSSKPCPAHKPWPIKPAANKYGVTMKWRMDGEEHTSQFASYAAWEAARAALIEGGAEILRNTSMRYREA